MADPTIFFCVGATKAGTTWLYDYLLDHPECHLRGVKELHYFDTLGKGPDNFYRRSRRKRAERLQQRLKGVPFWRDKDRRRKLADLQEWFTLETPIDGPHDGYLAYLNNGRKKQHVVGDITPCYSTLNRDTFAVMRDLGRDVRFVYLLRDPVDRAWSQARMNATRRGQTTDTEVTAAEMLDLFLDGTNQEFWKRSDYARTLTELTAVIPPERLHVTFYETLFNEASLRKLTDFLGLSYRPADFDTVSHAGRPEKMDDTQRGRAIAALRQQYAYCETFFDGLLPDRWRTHMTEA